MTVTEMIEKRKSCRSFTASAVEKPMLDQIRAFQMKPLYPHIRVHWQFASREQVKCLCPWTTPQVICIYSEKKEGYLENVGFAFQQMDLFLQSLGLGVCWLGMGKPEDAIAQGPEGMEFVIMLAFGHPKGNALRSGAWDFKRKPLADIADTADLRLEPARLAPSSVNSQPWYFTHENDTIHVWCRLQGLLKSKTMSYMNRIDIGIALAHLYITNPGTFRFRQNAFPKPPKGHGYIGSICL